MKAYKQETRDLIGRFLLHQLSFVNCIAALDSALAGLLSRLRAGELNEIRALMLANNETVMDEMIRRASKSKT